MAVFFVVAEDHLQSTAEQDPRAFKASQLQQLLEPAFPANCFFLNLITQGHNIEVSKVHRAEQGSVPHAVMAVIYLATFVKFL